MNEILFIAFVIITGIQLVYYLILLGTFTASKEKSVCSKFDKPVSVIICCKNEADNLVRLLPYFIKQNYKNFELVLINDRSSDNTLEVIENYKKQHGNLIKVVDVADNEQFWGSKKYALTLGIKAASHNHLLFSDADCRPNSCNWIQEMSTGFSTNAELILGYGAHEKIKNSFLNKLIRFETLQTALQYFSYAKLGIPYMGVGRNMGYTKEFFFNVNGFARHMHIRSGDDDLFVNENATANNTTTVSSKNSFTSSIPKKTWKSWILQKRRHISTARFYKAKHQLLLGLYFLSQLLFWVLAILLLVFAHRLDIVLSLFLIRITSSYLVVGSAASKLEEKDLRFFQPVLEIFLIFMQLFIFIKNLISKPSHW